MSITKTTLRHPVLTLIVFVLLGILGIFTLKDAAIALMPDIDSPYLSVNTIYENAGPESVEKSVTKLLEGQTHQCERLEKSYKLFFGRPLFYLA